MYCNPAPGNLPRCVSEQLDTRRQIKITKMRIYLKNNLNLLPISDEQKKMRLEDFSANNLGTKNFIFLQ